MKINNNNYTCFTSRNSEIRFADDIARHVNKICPRMSNTLLQRLDNAPNFSFAISKIDDKITDIHYKMHDNSNIFTTLFSKLFKPKIKTKKNIENYIRLIKLHKAGNCTEAATLGALAAKANGLENVCIGDVVSKFGFINYNHAVVLIKNNKNSYVIDPWLGFADYLPNAVLRYKYELKTGVDFIKNKDMFIKETKINDSALPCVLNTESKDILKACPELRIKKGSK